MKIDAIGLFVADMQIMVPFYRDIIGMETDWNGEPYAEFKMDSGSRFIMYGRKDFKDLTSQMYDYPKRLNGTMEIAFDFPKFCDVDNEFERLTKIGIKPVFAPATMPWGQRTSYVADPEGNLIEISSFEK